jgi:hypothetical protein
MQEGSGKESYDPNRRGRIFPLFVPVLWFLGGSAAWDDLTPERAAFANLLGIIFTAVIVAGIVLVAIASW